MLIIRLLSFIMSELPMKKDAPDRVQVDKDNKAADAVSQAADPTLFNHVIHVFIGALFQTK